MILIKSLELIDIPADELEKQFEKLVAGAEQMLRGRVHLSPVDWLQLEVIERLAFAEAGDRLNAELAFQFGAAVLNPEFQQVLIEESAGPEQAKKYRGAAAIEKLRAFMEKTVTVPDLLKEASK